MLKKSGVILLTLLYIITVPGFALNLHYCGKTITAVKIDAPVKGCVKAPLARKMKCCNDKRVDVKIKDAHQNEPTSFLAKVFIFQIPALSFGNAFFAIQSILAIKAFDMGPPECLSANIPVFLKNCTFRI